MENTLDEGRTAAIYGGSVKAPETPAAISAAEPPAATEAPKPSAATEAPEKNDTAGEADPLAQAEERGYRRGLAEGAREKFDRPAMWQPVGADRAAAFLTGRRPSVWD